MKTLSPVVVLALALVIGCRSIPDTTVPPEAPRGYANTRLLAAAFALGRIELVDLEPDVPDSVAAYTGIEYRRAGDVSLRLDLYRPKGLARPVPVLVFVHGGSWRSGKRSDYLPYLIDYAEKGYVTVSISYRLMQDAIFPAAISDVLCALTWIRAHAAEYMIDPDRIALIGGSAGAHLAMLAAYAPDETWSECDDDRPHSEIRAVVDFYGPSDFTTDFARSHPTIESFLGTTYRDDPALYEWASPITHVTPDDPPTLIFHGTIDETVPVNQSDLLARRLDEAGVAYEYHRLAGWPHAMDVAARVNEYCRYYMDAFFRRHLGE